MKTLARTLLLLCAASPALVLSGCGTTATIRYSQLANCWQYNTESGTGTAGDGLFMLYRINSIETSSGSSVFYFHADRLFVGNPSNGAGPGGVNNLISKLATDKTLYGGDKVTGVGKLFFQVPLSGDLSSQKHTTKPLQYKPSSSSQSITLLQDVPPTPDYLQPCTSAWVNGYSNQYP